MPNYDIIVSGFKESVVKLTEAEDEKKIYLEGLAIPFGAVSSNGVLYTKESLLSTLPQWENLPLMYNHLIEGEALPIGKVLYMKEGESDGVKGLIFKAELDPAEERIVHKVQKGFLNKVSIHILPDSVVSKDGYQEASVKRSLELSLVPVPGFMETNMKVYAEKFNLNEVTNMDTKSEKIDIDALLGEFKEFKEALSKVDVSKTDKEFLKVNQKLKKIEESVSSLNGFVEEIIQEMPEEDDTKDVVKEHESTLEDVAMILKNLVDRMEVITSVVEDIKSKLAVEDEGDVEDKDEDAENEDAEDTEEETEDAEGVNDEDVEDEGDENAEEEKMDPEDTKIENFKDKDELVSAVKKAGKKLGYSYDDVDRYLRNLWATIGEEEIPHLPVDDKFIEDDLKHFFYYKRKTKEEKCSDKKKENVNVPIRKNKASNEEFVRDEKELLKERLNSKKIENDNVIQFTLRDI